MGAGSVWLGEHALAIGDTIADVEFAMVNSEQEVWR
jgi:hypothetical protein